MPQMAAFCYSLREKSGLVAYRRLSRTDGQENVAAAPVQNWLPVAAIVALAGVLIVSGLVLWQRSRQFALGVEAYRHGETLLEQGQVDEAVMEFRNALAQTPQNVQARAALGRALVQSGHFEEAFFYLSEAAKADPGNGPVWMGLADVALAGGDRKQALYLFHQALSKEWPAQTESRRRSAQLRYADLLSEAGRRSEAISLLLGMIEQHGDDPGLGMRAAEMVRAIGSPEQVETVYSALARRFPADSSVWLRLGDARFAVDKDTAALDAYRRAVSADPGNAEAQRAAAHVEQVLRLDPTRRGLSVRERARRWHEILQRVVDAAAICGSTTEIARAGPLLTQRVLSLELTDRKMEAASRIWQSTAAPCKTDAVLSHILSKPGE